MRKTGNVILTAATFKLDVTVSYVDHDRMFFEAVAIAMRRHIL